MYRRIEAVKSTEKKKSTSTEVPNRVPTFFTEKVGTTDFGSVRQYRRTPSDVGAMISIFEASGVSFFLKNTQRQ